MLTCGMYTKTCPNVQFGLPDVFYRFLDDTCMTGRGFRDESCSRGLSTVTVEKKNVRFVSSFINTTLLAFFSHKTQNLARVV